MVFHPTAVETGPLWRKRTRRLQLLRGGQRTRLRRCPRGAGARSSSGPGKAKRDNLGLVAAGVAFYGFLAMAPLLASMVLIYGLVVEPGDVIAHVQTLTALVPADAAAIIEEQLRNAAAAAADKSGLGLLLALGLALFGAMKGAGAIITALNVVYEEEESRKLISLNLTKAAVTLGGLVLALCGLAASSVTAYFHRLVGETGVM